MPAKRCPACFARGFVPQRHYCPKGCTPSEIREALESEREEKEANDHDPDERVRQQVLGDYWDDFDEDYGARDESKSSADPKRARHKLGGSFLALPHRVLRSKEYAELTAWQAKLLLDIAGQWNGRNNGALDATYERLRFCGWHSSATLAKALRGLRAARFIRKTGKRGRRVLYGVTWIPLDECQGEHISPKVRKRWQIDAWCATEAPKIASRFEA